MYEIFEHTADLGIRVRAGNLDELFADAARGLFSVMVAEPDGIQSVKGESPIFVDTKIGTVPVRPAEEIAFQLHGDNLEELFHDWLAELLYTFHARRLVLAEFSVRVDQNALTATARGEPIDPSRHKIDDEVKAITWHGLKVEQDADGWLAEVIVDV